MSTRQKVTFLIFFSTLLIIAALISIPSFSADSKPDSVMIIPEVIWSEAGFGGEWATEIMIHDIQGNARVYARFYYGGGLSRETFKIWDNTGNDLRVWKSFNILKDLQDYHDPGFSYYGRVGALVLFTQGSAVKI